jgi:SAM-dependent methyltransferase
MITSLLKRVQYKLRKALISFPRRVECNVCHWQGRQFLSDDWHPHTICPQCGSEVRHRLLIAAMNDASTTHMDSLVKDKKIIHFAPEPLIAAIVSVKAKNYQTADLFREGVDLKLDMCDMREIRNGSVDLVIACDVLEHVPGDGRAMDELFRILSPGGWAILTVPQKDGLKTTYEDSSIVTEKGRLEAFGQEDHLRIYGDDFPAILESHRFSVITADEHQFSEDVVNRFVLFPPQLSPHPLATNFRKVFFAHKVPVT